MSDTTKLEAVARERVGKGAARDLRRNGHIPAVIYGGKTEALPIAISQNEIRKQIYAGGFMTTLVEITVDGKKHMTIPKDYQLDPVKDQPMHVDFLRVTKNMVLTVDIPVHFENEEDCPGIKAGGMLNIVRHTVEVNCPANAIPEALVVDLINSELGDTIHISMVNLPTGVEPTITDRDFTLATIATPASLASEGTDDEETDAEETSVEVEVINKKKEDE